jgi:hypothetical protein
MKIIGQLYLYRFYMPTREAIEERVLIPFGIWKEYIEKRQTDIEEASKFLQLFTQGYKWFYPGDAHYRAINSGILNINGGLPVNVTRKRMTYR